MFSSRIWQAVKFQVLRIIRQHLSFMTVIFSLCRPGSNTGSMVFSDTCLILVCEARRDVEAVRMYRYTEYLLPEPFGELQPARPVVPHPHLQSAV